jgi:hypothetical protein
MKASQIAVLVVLLLPSLALARDKKPPVVPALFNQATYVYVEAVDGSEFNPNLYQEDRQAIADVRDALQDWNRYVLTVRRDDADLVIVVRKGRIAEGRAGVLVSSNPSPTPGQPRNTGIGVGGGGEVGTPDDLFEVCQRNGDGKLSSPLWMHTLSGGLDKPDLLLFAQFKDAVDRAYPKQQTATQQKKP